jgi:copper chaperone
MQKINLRVPGISCSHCEKSIKGALSKFKGISKVIVDIDQKTVTVDYDEGKVELGQIQEAIVDQGYEIAGTDPS